MIFSYSLTRNENIQPFVKFFFKAFSFHLTQAVTSCYVGIAGYQTQAACEAPKNAYCAVLMILLNFIKFN
jgi:hypothetical protein